MQGLFFEKYYFVTLSGNTIETMIVVSTQLEVKQLVLEWQAKGHNIGFVPTMGALHRGHLTLVERAIIENNKVVVSIFVNPTQFNDPKDLEKYPRTLEADLALLKPLGVDLVYTPTNNDIYPEPDTRVFDFKGLDKVMEGAHRPGHFNGVAQVVSRLFDIVMPTNAYFGEKDYQQLQIILEMNRQLGFSTNIVPCEIIREADGLAMSSRNMRLSAEHRIAAIEISRTLAASKTMAKNHTIQEVETYVVKTINAIPLLRVEYFTIANAITLQPITQWTNAPKTIGCIAVFAGDIRLIDNVIYN